MTLVRCQDCGNEGEAKTATMCPECGGVMVGQTEKKENQERHKRQPDWIIR